MRNAHPFQVHIEREKDFTALHNERHALRHVPGQVPAIAEFQIDFRGSLFQTPVPKQIL